jgi:hypothetical protein
MYILIIHTNGLRRYKYILHTHVLNYQNVLNPLKAYHTTGRLLALCGFLPYVKISRPTCRLLAKRWFRRLGDS